MGKINLKVNAERVFGKYLPAVFIERIEVDYPSDSTGGYETSKVEIVANLSINFTVPGTDIDESELRTWFRSNFRDLYLYAWVSPHAAINSQLTNKRLNLISLFDSIAPVSLDTLNSAHPSYDLIVSSMLRDFATKEIDYFGLGVRTDGGFEAFSDAIEAGASHEGLAKLYYLSTSDKLYASATTDSSIMETLFFGIKPDGSINKSGPWNSSGADLPVTMSYGTGLTGAPPDISADLSDFAGATASPTDPVYDFYNDPEFRMLYGLGQFDGEYGATGTHAPWDGKISTDEVPERTSFMRQYLPEYLALYGYDAGDINDTYEKIRLTNLAGLGEPEEDEFDVGRLVKRKIYDSEGKEIFQISNIKIKFKYNNLATGLIDLSNVEDLLLVCSIGLSDNKLRNSDGSWNTPRKLFNNYFGGISYETILKYGQYDESYTEVFAEADTGTPYDGLPIQALNGKFYVEEPISRKTIIDSMKAIIKDYKKTYAKNENLAQNIKNLQYILEVFKESVDLFKELKKYQKTYTEKSQGSPSGRFYAEIVDSLVQFSKKIMTQKLLHKKLIMNSTVMDLRSARFLSAEESYSPYDPDVSFERGNFETLFTWGGPMPQDIVEVASDDYIPRNWMSHTRNTRASVEGLSVEDGSPEASAFSSEYQEILSDYSGDSDSFPIYGEILAEHEWYNDPRSDLMESYTGYERSKEIDYVVENRGHFFFDWEKALRTQSQVSKVIKIAKMHRFFGLNVPYKNFRVTDVRLVRSELEFEAANGDLNDNATKVFKPTQHMKMSTSYDFPRSSTSEYSISVHEIGSETLSEGTTLSGIGSDAGGLYGKPAIRYQATLDPETEYEPQAYLRFLNFDVAASNYNYRLEGFGEFHADGSVDEAKRTGGRIRDGYRLMCFQYRDFLEDDVAHYNTDYSDTDGRREKLEQINFYGEPSSQYAVQILVEDTTIDFFITEVFGMLLSAYDDLISYFNFAEDLCSFNNITNQFNEFFVDAIEQRYINAVDRPWIKAAYLINASRQVFFSSFEALGSDTEEAIILQSIEMVNRMGPERGTLSNLRAFVSEYKRFLTYFSANMSLYDDIEVDSPPDSLIYNRLLELAGTSIGDFDMATDPASDVTENFTKIVEFANAWSIDQPIYGEMVVGAFDEWDRIPAGAGDGARPTFEGRYMSAGPYMVAGGYSRERASFKASSPAVSKEWGVGHVAMAMFLNASHIVAFNFLESDETSEFRIPDATGRVIDVDSDFISPYEESLTSLAYSGAAAVAAVGYEFGHDATRETGRRGRYMAYMVEMMLYIAGGMTSLGFSGDSDDKLFSDSEDAAGYGSASTRAISSLARRAGKNINGLDAQSLLYVIKNEIYPVTDLIDYLLDNATTAGAGGVGQILDMHGIFSQSQPDSSEYAGYTYVANDHTGWSPLDLVWSAGLHWERVGFLDDPLADSGASYEEFGSASALQRLLLQLNLREEGFSTEPAARYYTFRAALSELHNALLHIIFEADEYLGSTGIMPESSGDFLAASPREFHTAQIIRGYLDPIYPAGPDHNGLLQDGVADDFTADSFADLFDRFHINLPTRLSLNGFGAGETTWARSFDWYEDDGYGAPTDMELHGYIYVDEDD
tara:strand:- start:674 stop:5497 length:4824 start_codon:yes stop_codon:yes gene_type:complete